LGLEGKRFVKLADMSIKDYAVAGVIAPPLLVELAGIAEIPGRVPTCSGVAIDLSFAGREELREVRRDDRYAEV
jgi:hypothetical protein